MMLLEKFVDIRALALTFIFILFLYWLWCRRHFYIFALRFPGNFGLPFIGVLHKIKHVDYMLSFTENNFDKCNADTLCTWFGLYPVLFTQDPVFADKILSSNKFLNKAMPMYEPLHHVLQGILTSPASEWRYHRKFINLIFSQKVLLSFFPIFNKATAKMIEEFGNFAKLKDGIKLNLTADIQNAMFDIALETVMGTQFPRSESYNAEIFKSYIFTLKRMMIQMIFSFLNLYKISKFDRSYTKSFGILHSLVKNVLQQKLHEKSENRATEDAQTVDETPEKPTIFIDLAFRLWQEKKFSWKDVIDESNTMLIASIETTSNALFSAIVMLAMHPTVQERLYEEITLVFNNKDIEVEYEHLSKLPYLDMVVQETLRLAPSVPIIGRQLTEPLELSDGVIVPKGMQVAISLFHIHRNKRFWGPNAEKFDPDNFLPQNQEKRNPHAYMPFSKGIRNCIGYRYAMFALKVILIGLVKNYKFDTKYKYEDLKIIENITLSYLNEPPITIIARN